MRQTLVIALLLSVFISVANLAPAAEEDMYFPLAQGIYKDGDKFVNNDRIVILPGETEKIVVGKQYPFYKKENDKYIQVGYGTVTGVNFWESYAIIRLLDGVESITTNCYVKVSVDKKVYFEFWWNHGTENEKKGDFFTAFCAFYRATTYKPEDQDVRNAYLRNGYLHYLGLAKSALSKRNFSEALKQFEFSLLFVWPGGDVSEAEKGVIYCRAFNDRKNLYTSLMNTANAATNASDYKTALEAYKNSYLNYASLYGSPAEKSDFGKQLSACLNKAWTSLSTAAAALVNEGKADKAYLMLLNNSRYLAYLPLGSTSTHEELLKSSAQSLSQGTMAFTISTSLKYLASCQSSKGFFSSSGSESASSADEMLTGLALAALARTGNTINSGLYRGNVKSAINWLKSRIKTKGKLSEDRRISPQIALMYGLAELYLASGNEDIHSLLTDSMTYLEEQYTSSGALGQPLVGIDDMFDPAILSLAYGRAKEAAIDVNWQFLDKLKALAVGRMDSGEKKIKNSSGNFPREGSEEQLYNYSAVLTIYRVCASSFLTTETMDFVFKSRDFKPSSRAVTPEGWYFNSFVLSAFAADQSTSYRAALIDTIVKATSYEENEFYFPAPTRNSLYRIIRMQGAVAFNLLSLSLFMGYEN